MSDTDELREEEEDEQLLDEDSPGVLSSDESIEEIPPEWDIGQSSEKRCKNSCLCFSPERPEDIITIMGSLSKGEINFSLLPCLMSSIERCFNFILDYEGEGEITWARVMLADHFYRSRHELLAALFAQTIGLEKTGTDISFREFGVDSDRTPDFITQKGGVHYIFEITVSMSEEKAFMMKGVEEAGFEAKYQKEIDQMIANKIHVQYEVCFFNMKNPEDSNVFKIIESLPYMFNIDMNSLQSLRVLTRNLSRITHSTREYLSLPSSILFSRDTVVESKHEDLEFLYNNEDFDLNYTYRDFHISMPVYQKISSLWFRLGSIRSSHDTGSGKFAPVLDISNNRITFEPDRNGWSEEEFNEVITNMQKQKFFEKLKLRIGDRIENASGSEGGVRYTKKVYGSEGRKKRMEALLLSVEHEYRTINSDETADVSFYDRKVQEHLSTKFSPVYYDKNYEATYMRSLKDFDVKNTVNMDPRTFRLPDEAPETLAMCETASVKMEEVTKGLLLQLQEENSFEVSIPCKNMKMKSSFILPFATLTSSDRSSLSHKNSTLIEAICREKIGDYTKAILSKVLSDSYNFYENPGLPDSNLEDLYKRRFELSNSATKIVKNWMRENIKLRFDRSLLSGTEKESFIETTKTLSEINSLISGEEKRLGIKKNIGMVRINCKPKSLMHSCFRSEMKHFKDKNVQSTIEGVGINKKFDMLKTLQREFETLKDCMTMNCGPNDDFLIDLNTYGDSKMLDQLKKYTLENSKSFITQVKDSMLGHSAAFISRLSHSLTFYSQLPFNNSFIRVDNLGYKNVFLLVKGGSKIFKTKSSKLFRLFFPCNANVIGQYVDNTYGESSFKHLSINGEDYIITPWAMLNENVLMDSISFYPRICTFCILNSNLEDTFSNQINKYFTNILLSFHNRRQTESMLANLRYILLSTMGDYSAFSNILPEFIGFNYDKVQAYLRLSIINNYSDYYNSLMQIQGEEGISMATFKKAKLKNIVTGQEIDDIEDLALMIYSTFLMTKAPYQRPVERANNLKGIIEIQKLFSLDVGLTKVGKEQLDKVSVVNKGDYLEYSKELMKSDFNLDPYYCTQVGLFADSYFKHNVGEEPILVEWIKIINKNWDSMATTTGLRGDKKETFWGQKGFFVIYDKVLNDLGYSNIIKEIFHSDMTNDEKRKAIRKANLTYSGELNDTPDTLIFHAVDKRQWRGGREIYVMDIKTKKMQQPIEKFMAYLCKKTDTELISIPSDKRSQVIHHALFEVDIPDKDIKTWFLTFDCSKWAPKSMFIKFALMILPMTTIPRAFKRHFLNYLNLLYSKRLYFNRQEVEVLKNNPKWAEDSEKYLISDVDRNGYYMVQPYSWVMGIFNYTSSLMHAFNQKYCSYILRESTMDNFNEECGLYMFAHSDDSGGRMSVSCQEMLKRGLFIYEINLKACNHLLSRKKCVVSRIYFEILSIIYMFSQLLALLPKFLGGVRFLPTDKGPAHDMLQSYSKCIELMVAGADFSTAYLYFKFYSAEIWRFYYTKAPLPSDYKRPPQYLGMPDSHPFMILLTGSDSDIIRIIFTDGFKGIITMIKLHRYFDLFESDEGMIRPLKFQVRVRGIKDKFKEHLESFSEEISKWSIANVNYKNTVMDSLSFLRKLIDPSFVGSLANETEVRRMSRAYYFRSGESVVSKMGNKKLIDVLDLITEVSIMSFSDQGGKGGELFKNYFGEDIWKNFLMEVDPSNPDNKYITTYFKDVYSNPLRLNEYLNRLDFNPQRMRKMSRTLKPTHLQIVKFGKGFSTNFDPTQLISYIYEPELSWALPNPENLISAKEDFLTLLNHLKMDQTRIDKGTALKIVRAHQNKSVKEIYMYSCIPGHIRLIKNFSGMLTFLANNSFHSYEIQGMTLKLRGNLTQAPTTEMDLDEEAYYLTTMLDLMVTIGKYMSLLNLSFNKIDLLGFEGGGIDSLIERLDDRRFSDPNFGYYNHYIEYIKAKHILWYGEARGKIFAKGYYYTYLKEQKFKGVWYGKGTIAFYCSGDWLIFEIYNNKVNSCSGCLKGKISRQCAAFINDTFVSNNINPAFSESITKSYDIRSSEFIGYDLSGDLCIDTTIHMRSGVPYKYQGSEHQFISDIDNSEVEHVKENLFISRSPGRIDLKIYTLRVERNEVIPIIKMIIDASSLEDYLAANAYNDFGEFISQSILTNYGAEYFITLEQLKDNYSGSLLYQMMTELQITDPEVMPRNIINSPLPAPKGSLLRMMMTYQNRNNKSILKTPEKLNPSIMSIRNEYPESFSAILSEKMKDNFNNIFGSSDRLQLTSDFLRAANQQDINKVRSSMIKLMCYWGHSSLINVLETYTFNRSNKNHKIFNLESCRSGNLNLYSELYSTLIDATFKAAVKDFKIERDYEFPIKGVFDYSNLYGLKEKLNIETTYSCYHFKTPYINASLAAIQFNNFIIGMIKDPDFSQSLIEELSEKFPLNSLSFDPKDTTEIISTYNTLRLIFIECNRTEEPINLNYKKAYDHLPHSIQQPISIMKKLGETLKSPAKLKYHCFLNDSLRHEIGRDQVTLHAGGERYVIEQEISELSETEVAVNPLVKFEGVLTAEYLESPECDDLMYELITEEPDEELIEQSLLPSRQMYEPTTIKRRGRSTIVPVKWVVLPYLEGRTSLVKYLNNIGENVVILSTSIMRNFENLRNPYVYLVNYSDEGAIQREMVAHVISSKYLKRHFWDKYIGGRRIENFDAYSEMAKTDLIRVKGVSKSSDQQGSKIMEKIPEKQEGDKEGRLIVGDPLKAWIEIGISKEDAENQYRENMEMQEITQDIRGMITKYVEDGVLSEERGNRIFKKYQEAALSKVTSKRNVILNSFFTEIELLNINSGVISGELIRDLDPSDHVKMIQAPEAFGVAYSHSKPDSKAFKDFRYKAELDALSPDLSDLISSSTLTISDNMLKIVKANYNSWRLAVSGTKHKRESKQFFLNLYLSIINNSSLFSRSGKGKHDKVWQDFTNNITLIIGEEPDEEESDFYYRLPKSDGLRLKYGVIGFD